MQQKHRCCCFLQVLLLVCRLDDHKQRWLATEGKAGMDNR